MLFDVQLFIGVTKPFLVEIVNIFFLSLYLFPLWMLLLVQCHNCANYRTRAIISRGLYIFYPIFKDHFFVFKEVFSENSVLMYGLYLRAAYDDPRTVYILKINRRNKH